MNDGLDPENWEEFRATAHKMLDAAVDRLASAGEGRVWTPFPDSKKAEFDAALPKEGSKATEVEAALEALMPYGVGNTHPRFFGWVHGSGSAASMLAEIAAAAMNANLGGRDHGAIYVERQVIDWARQIMGFPEDSSGLIVTGTSMATLVAMKVARDQRLGLDVRKTGIGAQNLVGYASAQAHSCVRDAFDMMGLGADATGAVLRRRHGRHGECGFDRRPDCSCRYCRDRGALVPRGWRFRCDGGTERPHPAATGGDGARRQSGL
jgi:hypothetical protein